VVVWIGLDKLKNNAEIVVDIFWTFKLKQDIDYVEKSILKLHTI
jgi:hypothetical protein